jgi:hypothetical protein
MANPIIQRNPATAGTQSAAARVDVSDDAYGILTPDALLAYCEAKLRGIDDQLQRGLANQKLRNGQLAALNDLGATLGAYKTGASGDDASALGAAFDEAMSQFPSDSSTYAALQQQKDKVLADCRDGGAANADMAQYCNDISTLSSSLNHDGEVEMIQLQSLMSQRQTAVQMCTNMVSALGETSKAIAAKIGS